MTDVLADIATIATDTTFRARVAAGLVYKANFIGTAVLDGTDVSLGGGASSTPLARLRLSLAQQVLAGAGETAWTDTFAWALAALPDIEDASPIDSLILSGIDDLWDLIAGQTI